MSLMIEKWYEIISVLHTVAADEDSAELDLLADEIHEQLYKKEGRLDAADRVH